MPADAVIRSLRHVWLTLEPLELPMPAWHWRLANGTKLGTLARTQSGSRPALTSRRDAWE